MSTLPELRAKFRALWPLLDERTRRLTAASEAKALGRGGVSLVRRACGLSRKAIGNLLAASTIEALPSTRLHDLWLQQQLLEGQVSFRLGQIALDDEFYISQYSAIFINSTFGCPDLLSNNLPSGGPCYPFAVREETFVS